VSRRSRLLLGVVAVAACGALVRVHDARADNPARQAAAAAILDAAGRGTYAGLPDADFAAVHDAWRDAGADLVSVDRVVAEHRGDAGADTRAYWFAQRACGAPLDLASEEARPGDLIGYKLAPGGLAEPWHIGMFVDSGHVVVVNPGKNDLDVLPWQEIGPGSATYRPVNALESTLRACRFSAALLPGGDDSTVSTPGTVSLVDPGRALQDLRWTAAHPRDADQSWTHAALGVFAALGGVAGATVLGVVELAGGAVRGLLERAGVPGALLLGIWGAMGTTFDGRVLHRVFTAALVVALLVVATVTLGPLGAGLAAGAVLGSLGAALVGVPVVGPIAALLWGVASFATSVITGVDDSERASVGAVAVALLGDVFVWLRPAALVARGSALPALRATRVLTGAFSNLGDLTMLRPGGATAVMQTIRRIGDAAWLRRLRGLPPMLAGETIVDVDAAAASAARVVPNALSLVWRRSSVLSDLTGYAASAASWIHHDVLAGARSWPLTHPAVRRALLGVDAGRRQFILEVALPRTADFGELAHMHSGARSLTTAASGRHLQTPAGLPETHAPSWIESLPDV
jgi:hypothetical protein